MRLRAYFIRIVILGKDRAGKSCLLLSYTSEGFSEDYLNTIGVDYKAKLIEFEGKFIRVQLWDTAGQERFHAITSWYLRGADGFIIVMDLTSPAALDTVTSWRSKVKEKLPENKVPILLIGTKVDLDHDRVISYDEAKKLADELNFIYVETSAKTRKNVDKAFEIYQEASWIINRITIYFKNNDLKCSSCYTLWDQMDCLYFDITY
ncbi:rab1_8 [Blepharisma stoltei]|uniref:Uncharacterized protein n=1 Tax=Blepharisma stoltei TaxID=1481888 RepID=A0AAU9K9I3_9CILI|nr:unnamed protein product [Blepharisma stoltei]